MAFFLSRCTCLTCYRCLCVINFAKIRKPYFAVLGQQSNLYVFNFTISSDCQHKMYTGQLLVPTQKLFGIMYSVTT